MHTPDNTDASRLSLQRAPGRLLAMLLMCLASQTLAQPDMAVDASLDAYKQIDGWVRDWDVPGVNDPSIYSNQVSVAIVTLRLDGRILGRGSSASFEPTTRVIWEATKNAVQRANAKLTDDRDAMWDELVKSLATRTVITVEIAERLVPISESELSLPGFGYTPGVLGVAVSRGDELVVIGPESMLIQNTDMTQAAMALANGLAGDGSAVLMSPQELAQSGYSFYRFEPVVLAQPGVSMGPVFIDRGGRVVDINEISISTVDTLAGRIAKHLISRQWAGVEGYGLMGTLDPVTGASASPFASPFEQAISAYALLRYGYTGTTQTHRDAVLAGFDTLRNLAVVEDGETAPWDSDVGACMAVIALGQLQLVDILGDEQLNTLRIKSIQVLDGLYTSAAGFDESVPSTSHGLVVQALVSAAKLDPRDRTGVARSAMDTVFEATPVPSLVAQMPFLGWACLELGQGNESGKEKLDQMRDLVWEHQLTRRDLAWTDRDLAGGIVFTSSKTPLPSWVSLKPMGIIATMLGDEQLTPGTAGSGEVPKEIGRLIDSVRYIRQLCAADEILHLYASPAQSRWGVRKALWDQRMPVEADAMAILTLTEIKDSFDELMTREQAD